MTGHIAELTDSEIGPGGFGFIRSDDPAVGRLYFNSSGLQRSSIQFRQLRVGDPCSFTVIEHPKGPRAVEVLVSDRGLR